MNLTNNKKLELDNKGVPSVYPAKVKRQISIIFLVILAFYLFSMYWTQKDMVGGFDNALSNMYQVIKKFFPPKLKIIPAVWGPMSQTIQMAIISTTIATIITIPLALLGARNISTIKPIYYVTRIFLNVMRTIPDLVLAVVFVGILGVGVLPGILALIVFSVGISKAPIFSPDLGASSHCS